LICSIRPSTRIAGALLDPRALLFAPDLFVGLRPGVESPIIVDAPPFPRRGDEHMAGHRRHAQFVVRNSRVLMTDARADGRGVIAWIVIVGNPVRIMARPVEDSASIVSPFAGMRVT
jgi:hypothetical protein